MEEIQLRPYQSKMVEEMRSVIRRGVKRFIVTGPTGCGKTVIFSYLASRNLKKSTDFSTRVLILSDRTELITQAGGAMNGFDIHYEPITAENKKINRKARCYIGMVDTYNNRLKKMPDLADFSLIIIDECHKGTFSKLFEIWAKLCPQAVIIGFSATPMSANKKKPLSLYYDDIVTSCSIRELIELGWLCECVTYAAKTDRSRLKVRGGEYTEESQLETFATRSVYGDLIKRYTELCDRYNGGNYMRTICFNVNIEHSIAVCDMFNKAGISAKHIDAKTPSDERKAIIAAYKRGEFSVLCNIGILNAGFDDPATECIIMNRATKSVPLWMQSCGRGSRPYKPTGKKRFYVLDMGDNWQELELWDAERNWAEIYKDTERSKKKKAAPKKLCDECGALQHLSATVCSECGVAFPIRVKKPAMADEFIEVSATEKTVVFTKEQGDYLKSMDRPSMFLTLSVSDLENIRLFRNRPKKWTVQKIRNRNEEDSAFRAELVELCGIRGYNPKWADKQYFKDVPLDEQTE